MEKIKIAVLVSGGGSNLQAIIDATRSGTLPNAEVRLIISNKSDAFALKRAEKEGIESLCMDPKVFSIRADYYEKIAQELEKRDIKLIVLAGFLLKLEPNIIRRFQNRILNIHPALLPKYGGKGMYGIKVHEAVLSAGDKESGCSIHVVDEEFDHGPILMQAKVPVMPGDTPHTLAERVLVEEHKLYPRAISQYIQSHFCKDQ